MRYYPALPLSLLALLLFFHCSGCSRDSGPPPVLPAEEIPRAMQKAFAKAKPEVKEVVDSLLSSLQARDYPAAFQRVQSLCGIPEITKEQRTLSARALLTINSLLQAAEAQGDANAAAAIQYQKRNR